MQNYKGNNSIIDGNSAFSIAIMTTFGDRTDQQDCFGYSLKNYEGCITICDGMGGHNGGWFASSIAVESFITKYESVYPLIDPNGFLINCAKESDARIFALSDTEGKRLGAGSTVVSIIIKDGQLYWCSVGDSRAYLLRGGEFVQFTKDLNYRTVINEKLNAGLITEQDFNKEKKKGEALISFLGIGSLSLIDFNEAPLDLKSKDKIIIMSDGLYKLLPDKEIQEIVENFTNGEEALRALENKANKAAKAKAVSRDNMTVGLITMK